MHDDGDRTRDERADDRGDPGEPTPDILPTDAPRGAQTVPDANDTGMTTPPISGWGETLEGDEVEPEISTDPRPR